VPSTLLGIDAFTDEPFRGNPAAVCLLDERRDDDWMQSLATEMNLSETAFVLPRDDEGYDLRWFTPAREVELCGHATLASAHALWQTHRQPSEVPVAFHTTWKGVLTAAKQGGGITLDFPAAGSVECAEPVGLSAALGTTIVKTSANDLHHIVELEDEAAVRTASPNLAALLDVDVEAVAVTARASTEDGTFDFVSRYFAPKYGVDEDPVTGSAHTSLGPYWGQILGKDDLVGHQVSARGGIVRVRVRGDRVDLVGRAVTVWQGELTS
jgi:PhzF family phenazine biosynthesis protein